MAHSEKTYVIFDGDQDIRYYNLMRAWNKNENIDFNFYDAHDLSHILWASNEQYIKSKLRERMSIAKHALVLIGDRIKYHTKYVQWEIELAKENKLPIIAVNLNGKNRCDGSLCHPTLKEISHVMHIPFGADEMKFALDNFSYDNSKSEHSWYYSRYD